MPVKVGVVITFFGIAALLRYGYTQGYLTISIEARLIGIAVAALGALVFGWRERDRNPAFGLSLQGGAIGVLMLLIFSTYRIYHLLPVLPSFVLIVSLVVCATVLAIKQNAVWIALLGFLGGYLAPLLLSTGSANHIALFSYYAILNAAVFAIAWRKSWRALNLMGFAFTFIIGAAWGAEHYRPEKFNSVEPFLILFFLFYVVIGLLYVLKQDEHRRPWVDGTLVFGTPLIAFSYQARLLENNHQALALSALIVALLYLALMFYVQRRRNERLLVESYGGLALAFATLAIPLAFSAGTTASLWALEGVGIAWVGLSQQRKTAIATGLLLQALAGLAYFKFLIDTGSNINQQAPILNAAYFGAVLIAVSGFVLSFMFKRITRSSLITTLLFIWAVAWWFGAGIAEFTKLENSLGIWSFCVLYLAFTMFIAGILHAKIEWSDMQTLALVCILPAPFAVFWAANLYSAPLMSPTWLYWIIFTLAASFTLWLASKQEVKVGFTIHAMHLIGLWTVAIASTLQWHYQLDTVWNVAQGWYAAAIIMPLVIMTLALWRKSDVFAWPLQTQFDDYQAGWFLPAFALMCIAWCVYLFLAGSTAPWPYLPIFNPLELSLLVMAAIWIFYARQNAGTLYQLMKFWPYIGFAFITMATLRAVHHLDHQSWNISILSTGFTQTSLTVVWSLLGVAGLIIGSRRMNRRQWMGGGLLMLIVLAKLMLIDRSYMGNIPGIVSFLAVGLLLVAVGYIAPQPPKAEDNKVTQS